MKITNVEGGTIVMSNGSMEGRRLYDSPEAVVIHIEVRPGQAIEPHATPTDMEFFVLEGIARFTIGLDTAEAPPGSLVESPKGLVHGISNPGTGRVRVLAIRNPRA